MDVSTRQLPPLLPRLPKPAFYTPWTFASKSAPRKEKRRRPEIFNTAFNFSFRRRRSSDYTPPISPRGSVSCGSSKSSSTTRELEGGFKRQRIDSSSTVEAEWASCDPHPGRLVDFTSSDEEDVAPPTPVSYIPQQQQQQPTSPKSEFQLGMPSEAYHDYLATTERRKSFPNSERATHRVRQEFNMLDRLEALDEPNSRKRVCPTLERIPSSTAPSLSPTTPTSSLHVVSAPLRRTVSDPSTEAFLSHVRASLEARRSKAEKWTSYPVFADEQENGFLDDRPL